jgi:aminopeptidase N
MTILQKQDSVHGVPIYTIPVNLGFTFPDKKIVKEVWLKNKVETLDFEFASEPLFVRFDEGNFLLKELTFVKSLKELIYQAGHDDMIGRLSAVNELRSFSNEATVPEIWTKLAIQDPFWAVRQAALENAGRYQGTKAVGISKDCLGDENSRVRQSAVRILGDLKDPQMIKLFEKTFRSENSYAVQAESLRSIGKCGGKQQLPFLKKAQAIKSYKNVIGKAATSAIATITQGLTK